MSAVAALAACTYTFNLAGKPLFSMSKGADPVANGEESHGEANETTENSGSFSF